MELKDRKIAGVTDLLPLLLVAVLVLAYWPSFRELFAVWAEWDQSLSHGYPLAFIFLFLIYRTLPWSLAGVSTTERCWALVGLGVSSIAWFMLHAVKIKLLEQFCLIPILIFFEAAIFGFKKIWEQRLVFLMPIYVIPVWDYMNDYLVNLSSYMVAWMVVLAKLPAMIDGNSIHIPAGQIIIADGCSGLRYLIISLALAHLISALNGYKEKGLLLSMAIAATLGLVTNWLRIFILICIGYATDMQSSLMTDHEMFGWILFGCICLPAIYFSPVVKQKESPVQGHDGKRVDSSWLSAAVIVLIIGPVLSLIFKLHPGGTQKHYKVEATVFESSFKDMPHAFKLNGQNTQTNFATKDGEVGLQINVFTPKTEHQQLVPYLGRQFDIETWKNLSSKVTQVGDKKVNLQIYQHKASGRKIFQAQWFDVGGFLSPTMPGAKMNQIPALFSGNHYFAIITLQAVCRSDDCEGARSSVISAINSIH